MAFRVFIDPGHGGTDPGAVFNERQEKDDVLRLALAVGRILEDQGIDVVYSRTEDFYDSPYEKAMKGNESEADLFLSIHRNAAVLPGSGTGADMLVYADTGFSADVANQIGEAIANIGFQYNGITERPNLAVLRRTKMPAVLVEAGFIDNENDNLFFDENFDALAEAIAQGVLNTFDQDHGFDSVSVPEPRTDSPESSAMNSDMISAFTDKDPAELFFESDTLDNWSKDSGEDRDNKNNWRDQDGRNDWRNRNDRDEGRGRNVSEEGRERNDRNDWRDRDDRNGWRDRNVRNDWRDRDDKNINCSRCNQDSRNDKHNKYGRSSWTDIFRSSDSNSTSGVLENQEPANPGMNGNIGGPGRPSGPESPGRPDRPGRPGDTNRRLYRVQVGAFTNPMFATQLLNQLLLEGFPAFIVFTDGLYRVQVGAFSMLENAVRMERRLRNQGYQTYITT